MIRALGIVRVSQLGDRDRDRIISPDDQADKLHELAREQGWDLTIPEPYEINVSGDWPLEDRPQLSRAVLAVQTGAADVICGAFTERLWWSHAVREQVLTLVQGAGGQVWSADEGELTNGTPAQEFTGTVRTAADRLSRRQNRDKSWDAVERAIASGRWAAPGVPVGYVRGPDDRLRRDPLKWKVIRSAFQRRAKGQSVEDVRAFMAAHGVDLTESGVRRMFTNRVYLGEVHWGKHTPNLTAHTPIVSPEVFKAAGGLVIPTGVKGKSDRLLARQRVLYCAACDGRMSASRNATSAYYRCTRPGCGRTIIGADTLEAQVIADVQDALADIAGRASVDTRRRDLEAQAADARTQYEAAMAALADFKDKAALARLRQLSDAADAADAALAQVPQRRGVTWKAGRDWSKLTLQEQREFVRYVIERVDVDPGRGPERVHIRRRGD